MGLYYETIEKTSGDYTIFTDATYKVEVRIYAVQEGTSDPYYKIVIDGRHYCNQGFDFKMNASGTASIPTNIQTITGQVNGSGSTSFTGWTSWNRIWISNVFLISECPTINLTLYNNSIEYISHGTYFPLSVTFPSMTFVTKYPYAPAAPGVPTADPSPVLYRKDFTVTAGKDGTGVEYYNPSTGNWDRYSSPHTITSAGQYSSYRFKTIRSDSSYQYESESSEITVQVKLNPPTSIQLRPNPVSASTVVKGTTSPYQSDGKFIVTASGGDQPGGVVYKVAYTLGGSDFWQDNNYTVESVGQFDDFSQAVFKAKATYGEYGDSDPISLSQGSLTVKYAPSAGDMGPGEFNRQYFVNDEVISEDTVVIPGDQLGFGWSKFPLSKNKGNFSYYKINLVPESVDVPKISDSGDKVAVSGEFTRNLPEEGSDPSESITSRRGTLNISSEDFAKIAGKRYKLVLFACYYYKPPQHYPNPQMSEGFSSNAFFLSPVFLVGGYPDTPTMYYPSQKLTTTFNASTKLLFKVTDSYTTIKDIKVQVGGWSSSFSSNPSMFKISPEPQDSLIQSGSKVVFTMPSVTTSGNLTRNVKISVTNSFGLTCKESADFTLNYKFADYPAKGDIVKKSIITDEDFQDLIRGYSEFYPYKGDVNLDGELNILDTTFLKMHLEAGTSLTEEQTEQADVNLDGKITNEDLILLKQKLLNFLEGLTKEVSLYKGDFILAENFSKSLAYLHDLAFTVSKIFPDSIDESSIDLVKSFYDKVTKDSEVISKSVDSQELKEPTEGNSFNHVLYVLKNIL